MLVAKMISVFSNIIQNRDYHAINILNIYTHAAASHTLIKMNHKNT